MKRGPYKKNRLTKDRPAYDKAYYELNRERLLAQHRQRYLMKKLKESK